MTFLDELGGVPTVDKVHNLLYDKLLSHPWLKGFFVNFERWHLIEQQTEFMSDLFGRPPMYAGRAPMRAHQHIFITEEIFMLRHEMLFKSLDEANISAEHKEPWLKLDLGMKAAIVKQSVDECEPLYKTGDLIVVPKPPGFS